MATSLASSNGSVASPSEELNLNASISEGSADYSLCFYEQPPLTNERFWLVTVFGTTISVVSIAENLFLFFLYSTRHHHRTTYNMYMMLLAFFDVFISAAYVCLMSVNVLSDYWQSVTLMRMWFGYMVPTITISHIAMTSSSFLILAATYERYCITLCSSHTNFVQNHRKMIAVLAIFLGIISKGTMYLEFKITYVEECAGQMTEIGIAFKDFVMDTPYHTVWRFWYRNFVTVFMPFFCLAYLNARIVRALTQHQEMIHMAKVAGSVATPDLAKRKATARSATRTMVLVVFTYLISNILNVLITVWEHLDKASLMTTYVKYYAIAIDAISLLTNLASASRLPIYLSCQCALRKEVSELLGKCIVAFIAQKPAEKLIENEQLVCSKLRKQCTQSQQHAAEKTANSVRHSQRATIYVDANQPNQAMLLSESSSEDIVQTIPVDDQTPKLYGATDKVGVNSESPSKSNAVTKLLKHSSSVPETPL
uniref:G-protein coupled receptors family 1 profile domain-containing protein n=1 Tax=Parascaris univalens TaxID=6257 RepID=A0A915BF36_PARUN